MPAFHQTSSHFKISSNISRFTSEIKGTKMQTFIPSIVWSNPTLRCAKFNASRDAYAIKKFSFIAPTNPRLPLRHTRQLSTWSRKYKDSHPYRQIKADLSHEIDKAAAFTSNAPFYQGEVFCNRNLNMRKITVIGFDMDYTLSQYKSQVFENLAYSGALKRLVEVLRYPRHILQDFPPYDHERNVRGLVVDKVRGNILKMDRHRYVKVAWHGNRLVQKKERDLWYDPSTTSWSKYVEPNFAVLDTIFSIPDAQLFSLLVQFKDDYPELMQHKSYADIYKDVRHCVDIMHKDGTIKLTVAKDPAKYIERDPCLISTLERFKESGRKLFLLTNSLYDYTEVVMRFLYGSDGSHGEPVRDGSEWKDLFDVIIVGACKPAFLLDNNLALFRVDTKTGMLKNTEGPRYEADTPYDYLRIGKVFQGGNYNHLTDLLDLKRGSQLMYVGDHMYSDILRTKRDLGWRTMLIIPELENEVNTMLQEEKLHRLISQLRNMRDELDEWLDRLLTKLSDEKLSDAVRATLEKEYDSASGDLEVKKAELKEATRAYHQKFHPTWGQLFKTGYQNSRFAEQVENYACLYTSRVSNMRFVSTEMDFRCMNDTMPHDRLEESPVRRIFRKRLEADVSSLH